jgi:acyl-CoA thioesterase FadM
MLNMIFRRIGTLGPSLFKKKVKWTDPVSCSFRVWFTDIALVRMNVTRYVDLVNLCCINFFMRSCKFKQMVNLEHYAAFSTFKILFFKSLKLFEKFDVITQIECSDDKYYMIISTKFVRKNKIVAIAFTKIIFIDYSGKRGGMVLLNDAKRKFLMTDTPVPPVPDFIKQMIDAEKYIIFNYSNKDIHEPDKNR